MFIITHYNSMLYFTFKDTFTLEIPLIDLSMD